MFGGSRNDETVAKSLYDDKVTELVLAQNEINSLRAQINSLTDTLEDLHGRIEERDAAYNALQAKMPRIQNSINSQVSQVLASVGVTQFAVETICNERSRNPDELVKQYNALPADKKREFYIKHQDVLDKATAAQRP